MTMRRYMCLEEYAGVEERTEIDLNCDVATIQEREASRQGKYE